MMPVFEWLTGGPHWTHLAAVSFFALGLVLGIILRGLF